MKEYFLTLFEYNLWANQQIINALKDVEFPPKCLTLFSHIISAQDIWFERIKKTNSYQIQVWDEYTLLECEILVKQSNSKWTNYLSKKSANEFLKEIDYRNSRGKEFTNTVKDILTHVLNHSNYHRAQINQLLSNEGLEPAIIDYIFYVRR